MREPCIAVGFTGTPGDGGHIRSSAMYVFTWLPKGYGRPSLEDRTVCALFDADGVIEGRLGRGERHPLVEKIAAVIEDHFKANPGDVTGFLERR